VAGGIGRSLADGRDAPADLATLAANAITSVTGAEVHFGTDNYASLTAYIAAKVAAARQGAETGN
jgi:hypothetical protein